MRSECKDKLNFHLQAFFHIFFLHHAFASTSNKLLLPPKAQSLPENTLLCGGKQAFNLKLFVLFETIMLFLP
jgi:hypothetical protein